MAAIADTLPLPDTITVGGKEVKLYPLTMSDVRAWNMATRQRFIHAALPYPAATDEARRAGERAVLHEAKGICFGWQEPGWGYLNEQDGILLVLSLSLSHGGEPVSEDEVLALFTENGWPQWKTAQEAVWNIVCLSGYLSQKFLLEYKGLMTKAVRPDEKKAETQPKTS